MVWEVASDLPLSLQLRLFLNLHIKMSQSMLWNAAYQLMGVKNKWENYTCVSNILAYLVVSRQTLPRRHTYILVECIACAHTHTRTHTYARTHAHTYTHAHAHTHTHSHAHTYTHTHSSSPRPGYQDRGKCCFWPYWKNPVWSVHPLSRSHVTLGCDCFPDITWKWCCCHGQWQEALTDYSTSASRLWFFWCLVTKMIIFWWAVFSQIF